MITASILVNTIGIITFLLPGILMVFLSRMFLLEKEKRAAVRAMWLAMGFMISGCVVMVFELEIPAFIMLMAWGSILLLFFIPFKSNIGLTEDIPNQRVDEKDIMFSRKELIPGSERYLAYYNKHPEKEILDNRFRNLPGLLSPQSKYYNKKAYEAADNYFEKVDKLHPRIRGFVNPVQNQHKPEKISNDLKKFARDFGALDVGITPTKSYHFYTYKGRGTEYGRKIEITHTYAIAFTVEMDMEMVQAAPQASIVMESARQYLNAGTIAVQLAEHIRNMGYDARAHIDGNYELICPLVARDAGLGEIGRMGLLMTPDHGPRVRIGVVTTVLELKPDHYKKDYSVLDFCDMCRKCAECCPGNSISKGKPGIVDGVRRWQINSESCFTLWCKAGTDCGRCMAVCPYSHPNNSFHKIFRYGIKHSRAFRYLALKADDFFYGSKPPPKPLPASLDD